LGKAGLASQPAAMTANVQQIGNDASFDDRTRGIDVLEEIHQAETLADVAPGEGLDNSSMSSGEVGQKFGCENLDARLDALVKRE
jgi:hypothetical protein